MYYYLLLQDSLYYQRILSSALGVNLCDIHARKSVNFDLPVMIKESPNLQDSNYYTRVVVLLGKEGTEFF